MDAMGLGSIKNPHRSSLPDVPPSTHQPPPECRDFLLLHDSLPLMPRQVSALGSGGPEDVTVRFWRFFFLMWKNVGMFHKISEVSLYKHIVDMYTVYWYGMILICRVYFFPRWAHLNDEFNSNMSDGPKGRTSKRPRKTNMSTLKINGWKMGLDLLK